MSKKNKLSTRVKQHAFDLKREKEEREKREKKAAKQKVKADKMKIDTGKQIKKRTFKVGKKRKFQVQLSSAKMAKASQAMEVES
ncbi:unnamed protein product [Sphagnum troendelagicum]|jgi:metal-dependent hydrolase (beta-lactamase superfamily II)|uniref:Uncharacterized protein n=3 Tax=Sphagnum TaxID=13804 RepID=A0ABP0UDM2_9BRYO|nr:hypothetical protein BDL97_16G054300 [Sphagnum fallax]